MEFFRVDLSTLKIVLCGHNYYAVQLPQHPFAWSNGYLYHHRVVMEQLLGRFLQPHEIVHHKDENGRNNDPLNLELLPNQAAHTNHHHPTKEPLLLHCHRCGEPFLQARRNRAEVKGYRHSFCSRRCNGLFYHGKGLNKHPFVPIAQVDQSGVFLKR